MSDVTRRGRNGAGLSGRAERACQTPDRVENHQARHGFQASILGAYIEQFREIRRRTVGGKKIKKIFKNNVDGMSIA